MNDILKKHLEKSDSATGTMSGLGMLRLHSKSENYYAANTYLVALAELKREQAENTRLRDALNKLSKLNWLCNCTHSLDEKVPHSTLCVLGIIENSMKEKE